MQTGKRNPNSSAVIHAPIFQTLVDFKATGSESTLAVPCKGDTDLEYKIDISDPQPTNAIYVRLNNASSGYGYEIIQNNGGSIASFQATATYLWSNDAKTLSDVSILTPVGFIKTAFCRFARYSSGTTIDRTQIAGFVYNSTANITSINFIQTSGNFTVGARIKVSVRRA